MCGHYAICDEKGLCIPNTNIIVDESIPPLFGYRPYEPSGTNTFNKGYVLYAGARSTDYPQYANNEVFPSGEFQALLKNIWHNNGGGSNANPAIYTQKEAPRAAQRVVRYHAPEAGDGGVVLFERSPPGRTSSRTIPRWRPW